MDLSICFSPPQPKTDRGGLSVTSHLATQTSRPVFLINFILRLPATAQDGQGEPLCSSRSLVRYIEVWTMQLLYLLLKHKQQVAAIIIGKPVSLKVSEQWSIPQNKLWDISGADSKVMLLNSGISVIKLQLNTHSFTWPTCTCRAVTEGFYWPLIELGHLIAVLKLVCLLCLFLPGDLC